MDNTISSSDVVSSHSSKKKKKAEPYYVIEARNNSVKLRKLLKSLPPLCDVYFKGISEKTSTKTRISYAYDLKLFFEYAISHNDNFSTYKITDFTITDLSIIKSDLIESFLYDLDIENVSSPDIKTNDKPALARKLFALRSMYNYFCRKTELSVNPTLIVDTPKIKEKPIVYLEPNHVATLLKYLADLNGDLETQKGRYFEKTKYRDIAIITLLLGTGIRVSELVGIDLENINMIENILLIHRKGGDNVEIYFNDEVKNALLNYINNIRNFIHPDTKYENALFLSTQKKRISVDAVENLVKKYTKELFPTKVITPHKLRSTFASNILEQTGDIAVTAELMGHKSIETTKKRYTFVNRAKKRSTINDYRLR
jgi:site-specific recombinase XerD